MGNAPQYLGPARRCELNNYKEYFIAIYELKNLGCGWHDGGRSRRDFYRRRARISMRDNSRIKRNAASITSRARLNEFGDK
jgi:hypothetical protein